MLFKVALLDLNLVKTDAEVGYLGEHYCQQRLLPAGLEHPYCTHWASLEETNKNNRHHSSCCRIGIILKYYY